MVDKTLSYIGFSDLLDVIQQYSLTPFTRDRIRGLKPLDSLAEIGERQETTRAVLEVVELYGPIPLRDVPDVREILDRLALNELSLNSSEFLAVNNLLSSCRDIAAFLKRIPAKSDHIDALASGLSPLTQVTSLIRKTINEDGTIEDSASYELSRIRTDLYQYRERARHTLDRIMEREDVKPVLQDNFIALRNGRYVIPLKPNFNQFFQGIVHDYSHSLKTSFVEPIQIMEVNNTISVLANEEKEEELKVLQDLTAVVRRHRIELATNISTIGELDFYHALARFAMDFRCSRPAIEESGPIELKNAINPFIALSKKDQAVPIDIVMGEDKKAVIISGPNADGKTVALKTMGLLLAMAFAGLYIPARETPRLRLFPGIFAVLGDEQNIAMELSTFTAHVEAIRNVYDSSRGGELVLIDEIGGGTEPQEASALSMGILDAFVEKGCTIVVTTHLNLLKAYGATRNFALNIATDFDFHAMKPLYRLLYGIAGVSNALMVAEKRGMPLAIIQKSHGYLGKQEYVLNDLIHGLEIERKEAQQEKEKIRLYRNDLMKRIEALKSGKKEYLENVERECQKKVADLQSELDQIRRELSQKDRESLRAAKEKVTVIQRRFTAQKAVKPQAPVVVGDYVLVRTIGKKGYITQIDEGKRMVDVVVGNMRLRTGKDSVEGVTKEAESRTIQGTVTVTDIEVPEVNVRGMRVDEALEEVDRFVDRALVHGTSQVKIVHGIGTGRLMTAIRNHLAEARQVKSVIKDEKNSGVTIVELL
jgi:DNA mismatch repair protein MutS2